MTVSRRMGASAEAVYDLVTDVTRMGEWSPENQGGAWIGGALTAAVGARFRGRNRRKQAWTTTAVVTEAERGHSFVFAVGRRAPLRPDTIWRYQFRSTPDRGCEVTETCELIQEPGPIGRFLTKLGTGVTWAERPDDLRAGMEETLRRLAATAEAVRVT
jgi:hypothetical protein